MSHVHSISCWLAGWDEGGLAILKRLYVYSLLTPHAFRARKASCTLPGIYERQGVPLLQRACVFAAFFLPKSSPQDWHDIKVTSRWRRERPGEDPVYPDKSPSIQRLAGGQPFDSPPDQMHTWHHGIGRDCMASLIASWMGSVSEALWDYVLLACRFHVFGGSNIPERLALAFADFTRFRVACKLHTSIQKFELATFKIAAFLAAFVSVCVSGPRLSEYPAGCGKGHDTAVLAKWLLHVAQQLAVDLGAPCLSASAFCHFRPARRTPWILSSSP